MLILGADTSGNNGSIALVHSEAELLRTIEVVPLQGGTFSAQLVPQIAALLAKHNLGKSDIDAFAVASGPGSFTGLRVGLAAIKALGEILQKPIAAASLLEVIAFEVLSARDRCANQGQFSIALDAGRNEIFVGEYRTGAELPFGVAEHLLRFEDLAERARESHSKDPIYTPDESVVQYLQSIAGTAGPAVIRVERPNALSVARLGWKKIRAGQTVSPEALDATYIRRSDAEIKKQ